MPARDSDPASPTDPASADFDAAVAAVTQAFGDPTRRHVYLFAQSVDDGVTASEVAEQFDLHPNVARHHLDKLAAGGYLEVHKAKAASGAGRPSKRYRVTGTPATLAFPVRRDELILRLLQRTLEELPPTSAARIAEEVGDDYGRSLAEGMDPGDAHRSLKAAMAAVADALTAHGFAAHAEDGGGSLRIVSEHCPFGVTPVDLPIMCALDRGMVRGMLAGLYGDTETATDQSRAQGDSVCVTGIGA